MRGVACRASRIFSIAKALVALLPGAIGGRLGVCLRTIGWMLPALKGVAGIESSVAGVGFRSKMSSQ